MGTKGIRAAKLEHMCADVYAYDQMARSEFGSHLCGIDEAGRGPLAGPVVAAAVVLPDTLADALLYDSKQLNAKERQSVFELITKKSLAYGIGVIDQEYIDQYNVLQATYEAMRIALRQVVAKHKMIDMVLVDGCILPSIDLRQRKIIHGDRLSQSIGAASILAKVTRDHIMEQYAKLYPEYGFERHMGYGTPEHVKALAHYGPSPIHRMTFAPVKACSKSVNTQEAVVDRRMITGASAELVAISLLVSKGYQLIERNWRTHFGEIDAIMRDGTYVVFVEVRSRTGHHAQQNIESATESVNAVKQIKLRRLALAYMQQHVIHSDVRFDVVAVSFDGNREFPRTEHYMDAF